MLRFFFKIQQSFVWKWISLWTNKHWPLLLAVFFWRNVFYFYWPLMVKLWHNIVEIVHLPILAAVKLFLNSLLAESLFVLLLLLHFVVNANWKLKNFLNEHCAKTFLFCFQRQIEKETLVWFRTFLSGYLHPCWEPASGWHLQGAAGSARRWWAPACPLHSGLARWEDEVVSQWARADPRSETPEPTVSTVHVEVEGGHRLGPEGTPSPLVGGGGGECGRVGGGEYAGVTGLDAAPMHTGPWNKLGRWSHSGGDSEVTCSYCPRKTGGSCADC